MNEFIYKLKCKENRQKIKKLYSGIYVFKKVYVNNSESRVTKESKNHHIAMHENHLM